MRSSTGQRGYRRRTVLGTAAWGVAAWGVAAGSTTLGTAGCDLFGSPEPPPAPDPLEPLRAQAQALADQYAAAIAAAPALAARLQPLRDEHLMHVAELNKVIPTPPASGSAPAPTGASAAPAGADPATLVAALRAAEETGQRDAAAACLAAPGNRAALVGSIAACRATHLEVLK